MKYIYLVVLALFSFNELSSQITFERTYGGSLDDYGNSIVSTFDGGYLIAVNNNSSNYKLLKTNQFGDTLWTKNYPFVVSRIITTKDSNYVMLTTTNHLLKIDSIGDTIWTTRVNVTGNLNRIAEDNNGDFIAVGTEDILTSNYCCNPSIAKVKRSGVQDTSFLPNLSCVSCSGCFLENILIDNEGNYIVCAASLCMGPPFARLIKMDTSGNVIWNKLQTSISAHIVDLIQTPDSGFLGTGQPWSQFDSIIVVKFDQNADFLWEKKFNASVWSGSFISPTEGGYLISGTNPYTVNRNANLMKLDSNFNFLWTRTYGGAAADFASEMITTADSGVVIIGSTRSFGNGGFDIYFIKTDGNGLITSLNSNLKEVTSTWKVYPNPTQEQVSIPQNKDLVNIQLFNIQGKLIKEIQPIRSSKTVVNIEGSPGIYLIRLRMVDGSVSSSKVVKQ